MRTDQTPELPDGRFVDPAVWKATGRAAPALPDGWKLADHRKYGRVFVTHTTPDKYGHLYIVLPSIGKTKGRAWQFCTPDELTYLD